MAQSALSSAHFSTPDRPLRLDTLVRVRWLALAGQTVAVMAVAFGLDFDLPLWPCLALIGMSALFNTGLITRFGAGHRPPAWLAAAQLAFDILQLAGLLWLTGGLQNPFSLLILAPVSVSATTLPQRETFIISFLAVVAASVLTITHLPLPAPPEAPITLAPIYVTGIYVAILSGIAFIAAYTIQVAREARQLADALAATELALSRQQELASLDGLAAAAAHELGTPLSTIALAAKEMRTDVEQGPLAEDVDLIIEQTQRCRSILARLRKLDREGNGPFTAVPLTELLAEMTAPFEKFGVIMRVEQDGVSADEPLIVRNAGLVYALGNLIENAAQFARGRVVLMAKWRAEDIMVTITDDGPGFQPELLSRIGEPYLTRRSRDTARDQRAGGLGLGVFIAKTLLERTGAEIAFANTHMEGHARVTLKWPRGVIENGGGRASALTSQERRSNVGAASGDDK